ncbi:MAG: hypothetical protein ACI8QC_003627 [Planctomycetota bacterium]|jgi:hypothetical protein
MSKLPILLLSCTLVSGFASALVAPMTLRHDVEEAEYIEFGEQFPAVAHVGGMASGTLVAPQWVLTAAHAPEMLERMLRGKALTVVLAGKEYEVDRVAYPKDRKPMGEVLDIALLHLSKPVGESIAPLAIYAGAVKLETEFVLAGYGVLAIGDKGVRVTPALMQSPTRKLRAGWNTFERYDEKQSLLFARLNDPDTALELEAAPCVGDSGGPALVRVEATESAPASWLVAGVIALSNDEDENGIIGEYGESFGMTHVPSFAKWIAETLAE